MKPVKYFLLARTIKILLQFLFLLGSLSLILNLYIELFLPKSYVEVGGWTYGYKDQGYQIKGVMSLSIPDTLTYYSSGGGQANTHNYNGRNLGADSVKDKIVNIIKSSENECIKITNDINSQENMTVRAISKNKIYNFFWAVTEKLDLVFYLFFIIILIKLTNRYMDREIFMIRSFKLVSSLGILLILSEILTLAIGYINGIIMQHPKLHTYSLIEKKGYNFLDLSFDFFSTVSITNIGIGILIILLSQVLKEAILVKQENELTI
ncbi:DUF2975 domain-containing protein [Pedobacter planticolens]|nr:DUF2975 domain-containing protein [Pedobacter planticolens]